MIEFTTKLTYKELAHKLALIEAENEELRARITDNKEYHENVIDYYKTTKKANPEMSTKEYAKLDTVSNKCKFFNEYF